MRRATVRAAQAGLALAALLTLAPLSAAHAQVGPYVPLASVDAQQPVQTGVAGQVPAGGAQAAAGTATGTPRPTAPVVYGFFRDPLWPGPGQRFIAADCPMGVGAGIIHYCPSLPPLAEPIVPAAPITPPAVMQCDPWFQYFPVCRRAME